MKESIRIGIAEDHLFVRQGLISLLNEYEEIKIVFDVGDGKSVLEMLKLVEINVLLLDIEMPIMDGVKLFEKIKIKHPTVKTLILSSHYKDIYIIDFLKKGAGGFLSKNTRIEKIVEAVKDVAQYGFHYDSTISLIMAKVSSCNKTEQGYHNQELNLTAQEVAIIRLICLNKSNKEIAEALYISVRTVEGHRLHIRQKTNCKNFADLTTYSMKNNLLVM